MKEHWELDLWKAFFGRLCIIFALFHLYLTWRVMGEEDEILSNSIVKVNSRTNLD